MIGIIPLPGEIGPDIGLVLMVAADHLDLHAVGGGVEIFHRELGGGLRYPVHDDIPVMLIDEAERPSDGP